jgi:hypothetical protein
MHRRMKMIESAETASREGRFDDAVTLYIAALTEASLPADERAHVMSHLASTYRRADRWDEAQSCAYGAVAAAREAGGARAEAHAQLVLGTILLSMFDQGVSAPMSDDLFTPAMDALDRAAVLYEELDLIDFYTCLLTIAEAFRLVEESETASPILSRVVRELGDPRWASPPAIGRHADHLRARALGALARIAHADGTDDKAREWLESAVALLLANGAGDAVARDALTDIAGDFRTLLDDAARADDIQAAANAL